ncbi:hypothetical protein [Streptomyces sp. NPDC048425]|uniref:hypothetical protein n=1 Tax=Streptomyces sp. NPDC048425 TaxID=3365548 RepID=UPI003711169A
MDRARGDDPASPAGEAGRGGQDCLGGYSLQAPADDPDALGCRKDGAPQPEKQNNGGLLSMGWIPHRRECECE